MCENSCVQLITWFDTYPEKIKITMEISTLPVDGLVGFLGCRETAMLISVGFTIS